MLFFVVLVAASSVLKSKCIFLSYRWMLMYFFRCVKYIDKNAYTQTAIYGYPFCQAAHESFFLILRNVSRMIGVGIVSELVIVFCKLTIVVGIGVSSFFMLEWLYSDHLFSVMGVVVFICIVSWFVANMFLGWVCSRWLKHIVSHLCSFNRVLGITISTLLQCFLIDNEQHPMGGSEYVPDELVDFMNRVETFHET